jgi:hypothetical protein
MRREIEVGQAALTYRCDLALAGTMCHVSSNSPIVGDSLQTWRVNAAQTDWSSLSLDVIVGSTEEAPAAPHFRGIQHLVFASFGAANVFVFDLLRRRITAAVSARTAGDTNFWDRILLPIAMGVMGPAVGVVPIHAASLAMDRSGLLIAGASGAGKSTLSVALAQAGFDFISDDWTYLALQQNELIAHGMSVPAKLLPDAVHHFPVLARHSVGVSLNQELAYELPIREFGARSQRCATPRWFFFLERVPGSSCQIMSVSSAQARSYVEQSVERLTNELEQMIQTRACVIDQLTKLSCWKLIYSGPPSNAVHGLQDFLAAQVPLKEGIPA